MSGRTQWRMQWRTLLISALVLVPVAWFCYTKLEWANVDDYRAPSREVNQNPLLASMRLLETYGYDTDEIRNPRFFKQLNEFSEQTLWINEASVIQDAERIAALVSWVRTGGHLMLSLSEENYRRGNLEKQPSDYPLLLELGIDAYVHFDKNRITPTWVKQLNIEYNEQERKALRTRSPHKTPFEFSDHLRNEQDRVYDIRTLPKQRNTAGVITIKHGRWSLLDLQSPQSIIHQVKFPRTDPLSLEHFVNVQLQLGNGVVTVLADGTMFSNDNLGEYDNGAYLLELLAGHDGKSLRYLLTRRESPGLVGTLWQHFPIALSLLGLTLALWVWQTTLRFGPIRSEVTTGRANLLSHLRARGHFWRRRGELSALTEPVRIAAIEKLYKSHSKVAPRIMTTTKPSVTEQDAVTPSDLALPREWLEDIAKELDCPVHQVQRALHPAPLTARELPKAARVLQHILHTKQSLR